MSAQSAVTNGVEPYSVPSLEEINTLPRNGCRVVSTFSGAGGSCIGYRMAGYTIVWANEFVPVAQASYKANAESSCYLDGRSIVDVQASDIIKQTGIKAGDLELFDGSPPCQAFSVAGKGTKGWGEGKTYEHGVTQKNEELFSHYIRLLRGLKPKTFIAENVPGMIMGKVKGMYLEVLSDLKKCGYVVKTAIVDGSYCGIPQSRKRLFFVGVRDDIRHSFEWPVPENTIRTVAQVLNLPAGTRCIQRCGGYSVKDVTDMPLATLTATGTVITFESKNESRVATIDELKYLMSFPADTILHGRYRQQVERLGNAVAPFMARAVGSSLYETVLSKVKT